jgi:hypothetical protein
MNPDDLGRYEAGQEIQITLSGHLEKGKHVERAEQERAPMFPELLFVSDGTPPFRTPFRYSDGTEAGILRSANVRILPEEEEEGRPYDISKDGHRPSCLLGKYGGPYRCTCHWITSLPDEKKEEPKVEENKVLVTLLRGEPPTQHTHTYVADIIEEGDSGSLILMKRNNFSGTPQTVAMFARGVWLDAETKQS